MTTEHRVLQSENPALKDDYTNCYYACRYCNRARSILPVTDSAGRSLLDPTLHSWADHFALKGDELVPRGEDADALYTREAYDLNAPRKVTTRRFRREKQDDRLRLVDGQRPALEFLNSLICRAEIADQRDALVALAQETRRRFRIALIELRRYSVVPLDAPSECRCENPPEYRIPLSLLEQTIEVPAS